MIQIEEPADGRPRASPEQAKHLLSDLKAMHLAGQVKLADGNTIQPESEEPNGDIVALTEERPLSIKRLAGAALFGGLITRCAVEACASTVTAIISIVQGSDAANAYDQYSSSAMFPFLSYAFGGVLGAGIAAILARRHAILAGLLANSFFALLFLVGLVLAIVRGDAELVGNLSYQLYEFLLLTTVVLGSVLGALIGKEVCSCISDLDLDQSKVTIFGIGWGHYFWILSFVLYLYLASLIMAIYAWALASLTIFYAAFHPSLWLSFSWLYNNLNLLPVLALWLVIQGFERFWNVMRPHRAGMRTLAKFWRVVLYGIGAPALAYSIAAISVRVTRASPKPTPGDWKLALAIFSGFAVVSLAASAWSWIGNKVSSSPT